MRFPKQKKSPATTGGRAKVNNRVLKVSAVLGAMLLSSPVWAQMPGGGPGFGEHRAPFERALGPQGDRGRWWNNSQMIEKLKLTDAQRKAMDETLRAHKEKLIDLRASLEKAELGMQSFMSDEEQPNEAKILEQIDKVAAARAELEKANARFLLAIRSKLTPEQWKTLQADRLKTPPMGGPGGPDGEKHGFPGGPKNDMGPGMMPPPQGEGPGPMGSNSKPDQNHEGEESASL